MAMRKVIPFLNLVDEIKQFLPVFEKDSDFFCTVWEEIEALLKLQRAPHSLHTQSILL